MNAPATDTSHIASSHASNESSGNPPACNALTDARPLVYLSPFRLVDPLLDCRVKADSCANSIADLCNAGVKTGGIRVQRSYAVHKQSAGHCVRGLDDSGGDHVRPVSDRKAPLLSDARERILPRLPLSTDRRHGHQARQFGRPQHARAATHGRYLRRHDRRRARDRDIGPGRRPSEELAQPQNDGQAESLLCRAVRQGG
jgi:hypothetical protein